MGHPTYISKIFGRKPVINPKAAHTADKEPKSAHHTRNPIYSSKNTDAGNYTSNFSKTPKYTPTVSNEHSYFEGPAAIHNLDDRWDSQNKPIGYILGASPGFAQFAQGDEKLTSTGLGRKISKASRMGFDFAMIDFEALSEMYEPDLKELIHRIKKSQGNEYTGTKFEVGLHLPTDMDLCIANAFQWTQMQEKLIRGAYSCAEIIQARFYLFHTSSNIRPHVTFTVGHQEQRMAQVSHDGINLGEFMDMVDRKEIKDEQGNIIKKLNYVDPGTGKDYGDIKITPDNTLWVGMADWFKAKFISVLFNVMGAAGDPGVISWLERNMLRENIQGISSGSKRVIDEYNKLRETAWHGVQKKETERFNEEINNYKNMKERDRATINSNNKRLEEITKINKQETQETQYIKNYNAQIEQHINDINNTIKKLISIRDSINRATQIDNVLLDIKTRENMDPNTYNRLQTELDVELNGGEKHPQIEPNKKYWEPFKQLQNLRGTFEHYDFNTIYDFWKNHGSECEERVSYHVIAKYMWLTKDPLWLDIVGVRYEPDKIIKQSDEGQFKCYDNINTNKELNLLVENLITAVASKYIQGHLFTTDPKRNMLSLPEQRIKNHVTKLKDMVSGQSNCEKATSVYWYTRFNKIRIYIETAMPPQGQEGQLRIMSANEHVRLVKHLDRGDYISYTMDFEHLMDNFIDPGTDIQTLADGEAKYITMLHVNAPRPVMGAHAPLDTISHDQYLLYKWMYDLKQKGMENAYIIWEMGSYGSRESATAFRRLIDCLRNNQNYNDLPNSFYGIDETFEAQQHVAIQEHAYDPLEGVLVIPEESHSLLSSAAKNKGKLAEWAKEKFR